MQKLHVACVDPSTGQARAAAQLRVYTAWTFNLATLYADDEVTPLPNPLMADTAGRAAFKVVDGEYDIEVSGQGFTPYKITLVQAMDKDNYATKQDLENIGGGGGGGISASELTYVDAKLEFGAKGDGVTDDYNAIQAAINSRRGPVYLRPGNYRIGNQIQLFDSTQLIGAGVSLTSIMPLTNGHHAIFASGVTYVQVHGLSILSPVSSGSAAAGIALSNVHAANLYDMRINGHFNYGIQLQNSTNTVIHDVTINNVTVGVGLLTRCDVSSLQNVNIETVTFGFQIDTSATVHLLNCVVQNFLQTAIACTGGCGRIMVTGGFFFQASPPTRGNWLTSAEPLVQCWFVGIGYANTNPMNVHSASEFWLMENQDLKTNTGAIWSTSSLRAWGRLSTTGFMGGSLGIAAVTRLAQGQVRITWMAPAVFADQEYSVTCLADSPSPTGIPIVPVILNLQPGFIDLGFLRASGGDGVWVDTAFLIQAGGKVIV